jgi:coenzyme F420-reducing hydrogenase beta subunit
MALPKINAPIFELNLPSSGQSVKYRPFLVKEQKILLIALEANDTKGMLTAVKQIINNCAVDEIDIEKMPVFDIEYFFLRLRAKSVGETVELNLRHPTGVNTNGEACNNATQVKLNLLEVEVQKTISHTDKIVLDEETGVGIKFKYPNGELITKFDTESAGKSEIEVATEAMINCIDYIFDKENIYKKEDSTKEELLEFIENLSQKQFEKLSEFFNTMPKLKHTVKWKCSACGCMDEIELEGLANFFD